MLTQVTRKKEAGRGVQSLLQRLWGDPASTEDELASQGLVGSSGPVPVAGGCTCATWLFPGPLPAPRCRQTLGDGDEPRGFPALGSSCLEH